MPTKISWCDDTWNPIRARNADGKQGWHCEKVTAACDICYAESQNMRKGDSGGTGIAYKPGHRKDAGTYLDHKTLLHPLHWRRARRIFPLSMSDLFGAWVPDEWIDKIFAVMALARQHTFQVLTKRPKRMREYLSDPDTLKRIYAIIMTDLVRYIPMGKPVEFPFPNIWVGTSICDQDNAEDFVPELLGTPAVLHFVSAAPLLGGIKLRMLKVGEESDAGVFRTLDALTGERGHMGPCGPTSTGEKGPHIGWVLTEGESGKEARPSHPDWFRRMRDDCAATGVPFHHKQWGEWAPADQVTFSGFDHRGHAIATPDGRILVGGKDCSLDIAAANFGEGGVNLWRYGISRTGRTLDGVLHDDFP